MSRFKVVLALKNNVTECKNEQNDGIAKEMKLQKEINVYTGGSTRGYRIFQRKLITFSSQTADHSDRQI